MIKKSITGAKWVLIAIFILLFSLSGLVYADSGVKYDPVKDYNLDNDGAVNLADFASHWPYLDLAYLWGFVEQQMTNTMNTLTTDPYYAGPARMYPRSTNPTTGRWEPLGLGWDNELQRYTYVHWAGGYLPGSLWYMYQKTSEPKWRTWAETWTNTLEYERTRTKDHEAGFIVPRSFGLGYKLTDNPYYKDIMLEATESLLMRYNPNIGCIKSWNALGRGEFTVIIDGMMVLDMVFWASKNGGDPNWYNIAVSHANKTMQNNVRPNGSVWQAVDYDEVTGAVVKKWTKQAYNNDTTWSRGQAWAIYGFTIAYRETLDPNYLNTAKKCADYFIDHLPPDYVPYWDFNAPEHPDAGQYRDSSAAAIAASGLLELSTFVSGADKEKYQNAAVNILSALASTYYLADGTNSMGILLHGTINGRQGGESSLMFGDHFFIEALMRYEDLFPGGFPPPPSPPTPPLPPSPTIYVDADSVGLNNGSSWTDAYNYLQDALAAAQSGYRICVAKGTYKPDKGQRITPGNRSATFQLKKGVTIMGGFAGFGEPDPNERNIQANQTILSGNIGTVGIKTDNSYHVVTGSGTNNTAVLDGFIITAGNANGSSSSNFNGGGIFNSSGSPTISNCLITNNSAYSTTTRPWPAFLGGGMCNYQNSSPMVTNCTFSANNSCAGGGIANFGGCNPVLNNCTFSGNSVQRSNPSSEQGYGGGIFNGMSNPVMKNCILIGNSSSDVAGGMWNAISNTTMTNCTFVANSAAFTGGIYNFSQSNLKLTNCIFWSNRDWSGTGQLAQIRDDAVTSIVSYCCVQNWSSGGTGNINKNPLLAADNYHLTASSPCINAGTNSPAGGLPATDIDNQPRIIAGKVDMGADEFNHIPVANAGQDQTVYAGSDCTAAVTLDGSASYDNDGDNLTYVWKLNGQAIASSSGNDIVNLLDFTAFAEQWSADEESFRDLAILTKAWMSTPGSPAWDPNCNLASAEQAGAITTVDLPLGEHPHHIQLIVSDGITDSQPDEVIITVLDNTPPAITLSGPDTMVLECGLDTYTEPGATAADNCAGEDDIPVIIGGDTVNTSSCGTYVLTYAATDAAGNPSQVMRTVTVQDTTPPEFTLSVTPTILWPPNHRVVRITPTWTVTDNCAQSPLVSLVSVISNEPDDGSDDGNTADDILIDPNGSISLMAERSGAGTGRIYTITFQAVDDSNNSADSSATVIVPHDQRGSGVSQ